MNSGLPALPTTLFRTENIDQIPDLNFQNPNGRKNRRNNKNNNKNDLAKVYDDNASSVGLF